MNLNSVCLCFEAFVRENGIVQPICAPVYSTTINNMSEFFFLLFYIVDQETFLMIVYKLDYCSYLFIYLFVHLYNLMKFKICSFKFFTLDINIIKTIVKQKKIQKGIVLT